MKKKHAFLVSCLAALISLSSFTTEDPFLALLKKLEEYTKNYPTEKVHLHLDKPYYAAGDDIWFKAYVADARTSQPASESNILYVELISERDSVYKQLRLPLENGISWGDFKLVDTLAEGNYRIRAYTQLMRNAGHDFFFDKAVKIGSKWNNRAFAKASFSTVKKEAGEQLLSTIAFTDNAGKSILDRPLSYVVSYGAKTIKGRTKTDASGQASILLPLGVRTGNIMTTLDLNKGITSVKTIPIRMVSNTIDVQFLPEGGKMVDGLASKIAVKAIDMNGKGIDVSGMIIDDKNEEAGTFQTTHLGMGSFYLSPTPGRTYTAKVKSGSNPELQIALPKVEASGYLISVNPSDTNNVNIKVSISADLVNKGELNLIAHRDGMVYLATKISTAKQVAKITMPNDKFPSGIMQLTLFSPQNIPVAERLVFVNSTSDRLEVGFKQVRPVYKKRENVELELNSPSQGSFSVAVTNTDVVAPDGDGESNILTSMLLGSDLKGYIEKPNYYFMGIDPSRREHLDNLLLTQGWRKTDWKVVGSSKLIYPAEKSIRISGTITKDKKPLANSKISLMSNKDGMFMIDTLSDKNGKFAFEGLEFADSTKFIVQARSEAGKKTVDISLDLVEGQQVTPANGYGDIEVNVNQSMQGYLKESAVYFEEQSRQGLLAKTILLNEVKIEGKKNNPAKNSSNLYGPGQADQVFDGDDMINAASISSYLSNKISGMTVVRNRPVLIGGRGIGPVKLVVDGNIMDSDYTFEDLKPEDIESIEILISPGKSVLYRSAAVLVTTRRGPSKWPIVKYAPGLITYSPKGYYNPREFYSPKYDVATSDKPDLRTTVFWKPNLATDEKGKATFDYFNTDQPGNYRIVVEGFDIDGKIARKSYTYKVD